MSPGKSGPRRPLQELHHDMGYPDRDRVAIRLRNHDVYRQPLILGALPWTGMIDRSDVPAQ